MKRQALNLVMLTLAIGLVLSGCNTVQGLGKDIKKAGEVVEEAAEDAKN